MQKQRGFKVRDFRNKHFFVVDDLYLNGYAKLFPVTTSAVYLSLCRHANKAQTCFPAQKLLAEQHGINKRTVRRAIKTLIESNLVAVKKIRGKDGRWKRNNYYLLDREQWLKPKQIIKKGLAKKTRGHQSPMASPEDNNDTTRGHQSPIKDTHKKDTHILLRKEGKPSNEINLLIGLFKAVNPSYERLYSNKTQRGALERLVKKFGADEIQRAIGMLPETNAERYAPQITTPYQLEKKLGALLLFLKRREQEKDERRKEFVVVPGAE